MICLDTNIICRSFPELKTELSDASEKITGQ